MPIIIGQILKTERNNYWIKEQLDREHWTEWLQIQKSVWNKNSQRAVISLLPYIPTVETTMLFMALSKTKDILKMNGGTYMRNIQEL